MEYFAKVGCCSQCFYCIWRERNNRLFQRKKKKCNKDAIIEQIVNVIKMKMVSMKIGMSAEIQKIKLLWGWLDSSILTNGGYLGQV